ncbi:zinc-binding alcohol dehydrogenase family protein [Neoactinobaculum massilliense]|uniref:zinc-binding alcohol dehydrogenase family protein n=1 Tax=Neoactinobaculum massilliense TaxID=2364794 RepID=UPI000F537876|nr:zinc-binding alcohol dehydrogenase family protein [Neoactinobaculum massilliense]
MRAIGYTTTTSAPSEHSFVERELEIPQPRPHDVVVQVAAVSINPVDTSQRRIIAPHGFRVLGFDGCGTVVAAGVEAGVAVGSRVYYAGAIDRPGSNQQFQAVDGRIVAPAPASLSDADAAALPLTSLTAWECLFDRLEISADSHGDLLIVGGSGGVGVIAIQLAHLLAPRVRVIATASPSREALVRSLGADAVVDHHSDLVAQVKALAPGGVKWILSAYSKGQEPIYAHICAPFAKIVAIDGGSRDIAPLMSKSVSWGWEFMFTASKRQDIPAMEHQGRILKRVAELVDAGRIHPVVAERLSPISAATLRHGHELSESHHLAGKVVLSGWAD